MKNKVYKSIAAYQNVFFLRTCCSTNSFYGAKVSNTAYYYMDKGYFANSLGLFKLLRNV